MDATPGKPFSDRSPWLAVARAYARALWLRRRLPPGKLVDIGELERGHRLLLIDSARQYGPVFKGLMDRRLVVCVVGHALGRRLLKEHASSLRAVSIRLESLFPHGFMRGMEGEVHRGHRKNLVRGISALNLESFTPRFEAIAAAALAAYADNAQRDFSSHAWADTLGYIANSALIVLFFGAEPGSTAHQRLLAAYHQLGPHGVVWNPTERQIVAYRALSAEVTALGADAGGLFGQLLAQSSVDATMLGNLIYMVELGRYDLRGLLRWISRYAADDPAWLERIVTETEGAAPATNGTMATEAFVLEALRMDQSERLMRDVQRDIVFDDWLIPQGSLVRVCMWEAHKDVRNFPRPFQFDPARFLDRATAGDNFSPFGLDHHHCPLAGPVVQIAMAFLRVLAQQYTVRGRGAEPAVRGPYHWEPSPRFELTLERRAGITT
jgi:cytochrome P450